MTKKAGRPAEVRYNHNHDPVTGRFVSAASVSKRYSNGGAKTIDKSEKSGIIKSSDDSDYISANGPNEFERGFDAYNLADHWYGNPEKSIHSHKDEYKSYTMKQYAERALTLVQQPTSKDILGHKTRDGFVVRYDKSTQDFVKGNPKSGIKTMFKASESYYQRRKKNDTEE